MVVLVTGSSGQLGQSLQFIAKKHPKIQFKFFDSKALDITNIKNCSEVFSKIKPQYCINTAAYTAVDKAESESEKARIINVDGAKNLAKACKEYSTTLIHISTDFVFDGSKTVPYTEEDATNPQSVYGQTKLDAEAAIQAIIDHYYIIRTSWVYSQFGANFMKTILRLASERTSLSVVNDQIGTPTNAVDLAETILKIITFNIQLPASNFGIYNYSNDGQCSWYEFAHKIVQLNERSIVLRPITTLEYPTPAKRPKYSVLDKTKIKSVFGIEIFDWKESLKNTI